MIQSNTRLQITLKFRGRQRGRVDRALDLKSEGNGLNVIITVTLRPLA